MAIGAWVQRTEKRGEEKRTNGAENRKRGEENRKKGEENRKRGEENRKMGAENRNCTLGPPYDRVYFFPPPHALFQT